MRKRIINCTLDLLARSGFRHFTMDQVAARLRISKRTIYQHFDGKNQLLEACLEEWFRRKRLFLRTNDNLIDELCRLYAGIRGIDLRQLVRACGELRESCEPVYRYLQERLFLYAEQCGERADRDSAAGYLCRTVSRHTVSAVVSDFLLRLFEGDGSRRAFRRSAPPSPEILMVFLRGLCTIKGRSYLDQRLKTLN